MRHDESTLTGMFTFRGKKMKTTSAWTAAGCVLMALTSGFANAQDTTFTLVNNTEFTIYSVYFWPVGTSDTGTDQLGQDTIGSGSSYRFEPEYMGRCRYHIRVVRAESGQETRWSNVDLCRVSRLTLHFDYTEGQLQSRLD